MGEEEGIILTKYTDSNVYSLKKNEITLLKDSIIGVIYIKVSSIDYSSNPKIDTLWIKYQIIDENISSNSIMFEINYVPSLHCQPG